MPAADADAAFADALAVDNAALSALARRLLGDAEAEDALQEAWLRAWLHRDALRVGAARRGWLRRIVVHECLRQLRWRAVRRWLPFGDAVPDVPADPTADTTVDLARARVAVAALPARQRVVWGLRFDEGWTLPEIADALGVSPETVKTQLGRALLTVRARLEVPHV